MSGEPISIAWSADGTQLAVASLGSSGTGGSIQLVSWPSLDTHEVSSGEHIQADFGGVGIGTDGTVFWLAESGPTSHIQQSKAGQISDYIALPDADYLSLQSADDGLYLWHEQDSGGAGVTAFRNGSAGTADAEAVFATDKYFPEYWVSQDGAWFVAAISDEVAGPSRFEVMHAGSTTEVLPDAHLSGPPSMTPDHTKVVFPDHDVGDISAVAVGGGPRTTLLDADAAVAEISSNNVLAYLPLAMHGSTVCFHQL